VDCVTLRTSAIRIVGRVATLGVAPLAAGAVDIDPRVVHVPHRPTERDVVRIIAVDDSLGGLADVGGRGPVEAVVGLAVRVGDLRAGEQRVNRRGTGRVGRPTVVHDALKLLCVW